MTSPRRRPPSLYIRRSCSYSSDAAVASPSDFHSYLCDRIGRARDRMILASLYVGVGSGTYDDVPISTTATTAPDDDDDDDGPDDDASSFGGSVRRAQSRIIPSSATHRRSNRAAATALPPSRCAPPPQRRRQAAANVAQSRCRHRR